VRHFDGSQLVDTLELLLDLDHLSLRELSELRAVVEGQNAVWAAERRTEDDIARLRAIVAKVHELEAELNEGSPDAWPMILAEDALFHRELARTGHNRAAEAFMIGALGVVNRQLSKLPERCAPEITRSLDEITESVARGDAEEARQLISDHIQYFALGLAEERRAASERT
jgi:DNA-binding FadR family transcriptional regulator